MLCVCMFFIFPELYVERFVLKFLAWLGGEAVCPLSQPQEKTRSRRVRLDSHPGLLKGGCKQALLC